MENLWYDEGSGRYYLKKKEDHFVPVYKGNSSYIESWYVDKTKTAVINISYGEFERKIGIGRYRDMHMEENGVNLQKAVLRYLSLPPRDYERMKMEAYD